LATYSQRIVLTGRLKIVFAAVAWILLSSGALRIDDRSGCVLARDSKAEMLGNMALRENEHTSSRYKALEHVNEALKLEPKNPNLMFVKATVLRQTEEDSEALTYIREAIKLNPKVGAYWDLQGHLLRYGGKFEEALACANQAVKLAPQDDSFLVAKARILIKLKRFKEAEAIADQLVAKAPHFDMYRDIRISAMVPQGKWNRVIEDASAFLKVNQNNAATSYDRLLIRADAYTNTKQYQKAVDDCLRAHKLFPDHRDPHKKLVKLYTLMGDPKRAQAEWKSMNELDADMSPWK
jgi:tetratricopeptide (TPR) repeat protein